MAKVFRTMFDEGGMPKPGDRWGHLGVRSMGPVVQAGQVPPRPDVDVVDGRVVLNRKGMSVFRSLTDLELLPARLVPRHLANVVYGAKGPPGTRIWSMGDGEFRDGPVGPDLSLACARASPHGAIHPIRSMTVAELQSSLAATRGAWRIDEPPIGGERS